MFEQLPVKPDRKRLKPFQTNLFGFKILKINQVEPQTKS
jgi:hypothetical protein